MIESYQSAGRRRSRLDCLLSQMEIRKFNGQRLKEALQFRGKRMTELANELDISKQSLSLYANGDNNPPYDNVVKISCALGFPFEYFMSEDLCTTKTDNVFFRSQASAKKLDQNAQKSKLEYVAKVYEVLLNYVDFPNLNLPSVQFNAPSDPFEADSEEVMNQIEIIASATRRHWGVGTGPIDNMQYMLESNGLIVTGFKDRATTSPSALRACSRSARRGPRRRRCMRPPARCRPGIRGRRPPTR